MNLIGAPLVLFPVHADVPMTWINSGVTFMKVYLSTCWESGEAVPDRHGRRPGAGSSRLAMSPIMAHLTMASAGAGRHS